MERSSRFETLLRSAVIVVIAVLAGACTVGKQEPPSLAGPSGYALSLQVTAAPQILARDGSSMSTITILARNPDGTPLSGRRLRLSASAGTLTVTEVNTSNAGSATVTYIAPDQNINVQSVTIAVSPVEVGDDANTHSSSVRIEVVGPGFPVPSIEFSPAAPAQFQAVSFNASGSMFGGAQCGSACSYAWDFGDGSTSSAMLPTHAFQNTGTFVVTMTVTAPVGTSRSTTRSITVGPPALPTVSLIFSPTNPNPTTTVNFTATGTALNGATISRYEWNFGGATTNGGLTTNTGSNTAVFNASPASSKTYVVTVTAVDSNDQRATATVSVTVAP